MTKWYILVYWNLPINSLWPSDVIWWHRSRSTFSQVMTCNLMAPRHYLNQCWFIISMVTFMWGQFHKRPVITPPNHNTIAPLYCPYQSPLDRLVDLGKTLSVLGLQLKVDVLPLGLEHVLLTLLLPDGVLALLDHRLRLCLDGCQGLLIMFHPIVLREKDVINPLCAEWLWRKNDHSGHGLSQCETMLRCNIVSHWLRPYPEWSLRIISMV